MAEQFVRVRPPATEAYLANPHKGCCTFQNFNGDELFPATSWSEAGPTEFPRPRRPRPAGLGGEIPTVIPGYLPTTVADCRWFWDIMEPQQGRCDFSVIEKSLETCKQTGQTLSFRAMAFGAPTQAAVPKWYGGRYPMQRYHDSDFLVPVPDSPEYLEHWGNFLRQLGQRFDGHPLIENCTCAYMGPWGEGDADMSDAQKARFSEVYKEAFPRTMKIWQLGGEQAQIGIRATGGGWRMDSFGDLWNTGSDAVSLDAAWNHHYDFLPEASAAPGVVDIWKTGPVFMEAGGVPMNWYQRGFDLDFILQQGLKCHMSYFMPKYTYLPDAWIEKLDRFCRRIGYRYVFRQAKFESKVPRGGQTAFDCWIENVGVAPIYRRYEFALRFRQDDRSFVVPFSDVDIRTWLPGDTWLLRSVPLPPQLRTGLVELSAGLIDGQSREAKGSFANTTRFKDRWLLLGKFEVI